MKPEAVARTERVLDRVATSWERVAYRGWSRAEHWTIAFADGGSAFAKVASIAPHPGWLRREREVLAGLDAPFAPRLLGFDDGEQPLLVLEDLSEGAHWPPPWRPGDVELVLAALEELSTAPTAGLEPFAAAWRGWRKIAEEPQPFLSLGVASAAWLERCLPALVEAETTAPVEGDSLLHCDVRSDNLCLRGGRAVFVDWNFAQVGNPGLDVALWLPSLELEGGPKVAEVARSAPAANAFAPFLAGFFAGQAGLPPPEGAPRVRGFQLAQLEIALPWACDVLGLEPPDGL